MLAGFLFFLRPRIPAFSEAVFSVLMPEPVEQVDQQGKKDTQDYGGCKGKVEAEVFPLNRNIAREFSEERKAVVVCNQQSHDDKDNSCDNQHLAHTYVLAGNLPTLSVDLRQIHLII